MKSPEVFEIEEKDLLGRIGKLFTDHGVVETPTLAPVINPSKNVLEPKSIKEIGFTLLMTNAYLIKKSYDKLALEMGVHNLLGVETPIMTDSGAYQLMTYGSIEVDPLEIVEYQVSLGSDIGVILDIPTRKGIPKDQVRQEVEETLKRAKQALNVKRDKMLLVGPVQGGLYLDLVAYSASKLSKLDFDVYAVGGPVQIMENYEFRDLVKLVMTAKMNLPLGKPLHLFGAGHPLILPLAVAMGVDTFDSASYALYAKNKRYMTPYGTLRLKEMRDLPCNCPVCSSYDIKDLIEMPSQELVEKLSQHNLYVLRGEIREIKEAIHEGRLWELLEIKATAHPSAMEALIEFRKYIKFIEKYHPETRGIVTGLFFPSSSSRWRPEVYKHLSNLKERFIVSKDILVLIQETPQKPFTRFGWIAELLRKIDEEELLRKVHVAIISSAFSVIPIELDGYYPLSQYEVSSNVFIESYEEIASDVEWYIRNKNFKTIFLIYYSLPAYIVLSISEKIRRIGVKIYPLKISLKHDDIGKTINFIKKIANI